MISMEILRTILDKTDIYKKIISAFKKDALIQVAGFVPSAMEHFIYSIDKGGNPKKTKKHEGKECDIAEKGSNGNDGAGLYDIKLIIAQDEIRAREILANYMAFDKEAAYYPAVDPMFFKADISGSFITEQRIEVIKDLYNGRRFTIVTTPQAFEDRLVSKSKMQDEIILLRKGGTANEEEIAERLTEMGYENESQVTAHGEFSIRGNIIDIFPFTEDAPYRIDLFGDEIETIKYFDTESQRSIEEVEEISIYPGGVFNNAEVPFIEYFDSKKTLFVIDEPDRTLEDYEELADELSKRKCLMFTLLDQSIDCIKPQMKFTADTKNIASYNGRFLDMTADLKRYKKEGYRVLIYAATASRVENMVKNLQENGISAFAGNEDLGELKPGLICVVAGALRTGFEYPDLKFCVMSEVDIFGKRKIARRKKRKYSGDPIRDFLDLNINDYVVHENHGVGIYRGIERMTVDGCEKDYMKIEYAKNDCLFVLASDFDKIQKYAGSDAAKPKINRIGGKEWANTKARVNKSVQDIAQELIRLYAVRQSKQGHKYMPDTVWQSEFESQFEFEETEDQLKAIEDVKSDMESGKIMDRLICGDVGFGKTEVAIRAAFKAVQEGKQAAFLVPTTVLAQQHFNTISKRMENFPVTVRMLSRFSTPAEQKETLKELKNGMTDIVVGTHRLLSKDIEFKDLGLLVIDEEQRFGVAHKEKIKNLRKDVDVLTLSATPIPRTLHMSIANIRDMSLLTEPPVDRVPIQTYVMEYSDEAVKEAIVRESRRGGQVYYVYNRVDNIDIVANKIQQMVPELNVQCAHGQMKPKDLEAIMADFTEGLIDVLVSTTIIETGLDISNVNTIIVHDADKFGLSQLYQLRGRVGRSNRTAYAFLLFRKDKLIKEVAEKRLKAIREFSELGSGIKIAMRDLEIRGAGNILGAEQSGHMEAVGYELYCKMLNRAVMMLKGEEIPEEFETAIDLDIDGYIPSEYIKNEFEKLSMYKKIAAISDIESLEDIQEELMDRFGPVPKAVGNLLTIALIKAKAHEVYITEISGNKSRFKIGMFRNAKIDVEKLPEFLQRYAEVIKFYPDTKPYFVFTPAKPPTSVKGIQDTLLEFFALLATVVIK